MWKLNLIRLCCAVCDNSSTIESIMQRQSNHFRPQFSDEECITVYLWGICQRRFELKAVCNYTKNHLLEWFPRLPGHQAFVRRVARLNQVFRASGEIWMNSISCAVPDELNYMVDSCPIILVKGLRSAHAKVAPELCSKTYNSSRNEWYYGMKLHAFVSHHVSQLPTPVSMAVSDAAVHDLNAARQITMNCRLFRNGKLYADKAYIDLNWCAFLRKEFDIQLLTPRKKKKGEVFASGDTFSRFVSSVRQPIESFFYWLNHHTAIQSASAVRSDRGLLSHIFGRLAAAMALLLFNL